MNKAYVVQKKTMKKGLKQPSYSYHIKRDKRCPLPAKKEFTVVKYHVKVPLA
jgi:hypothetical protein